MTYLPTIDELACSGHGDCAAIAPGVFTVEEVAEVIGEGPDQLIIDAAESCPALAITVTDSETGEVVFP
jgi:ferredoxin